MNRVFQQTYHIPGTLAANVNIRFTVPFDCQLIHCSAVGSNANDGLLTLGLSTDTDEYLTSSSIGDSNVPAEFDGNDFVDSDGNTHDRYFPHIADGTVFVIILDYDGAAGVATDDFTIVLTFTEG